MSLDDQLEKIRQMAATRVPEEQRAVMGAATRDLRDSGILDGTIKVGDGLPAFALDDVHGQTVVSTELLARGPVVLTVFRGVW